MKSRRIFGLIAAALMTVSSLATLASATEIEPYNNHEDEYFEFFLVNDKDRTSMRRKEDYTSMYMKCDYIGSNFEAIPIGAHSNQWGAQAYWCNDLYYFITQTNKEYFISNQVKEKGYEYGAIYGIRDNPSGTVHGVWSPDSI